MSYVDAYFNRERDQLYVVERVNGKREYTDYPARYVFYYEDVKGKHRSIYNTPVSRVSTKQNKDFQKELAIHKGKQIYEADINPIFRCLAENYLDAESPTLNICYVDIEADFDPQKGFSQPEDPTASVTAITVYLSQLQQLITLALKPKTMHENIAQGVAKHFENTFVYNSEAQLLQTFLDLIEDSDIITGTNVSLNIHIQSDSGYNKTETINLIAGFVSQTDPLGPDDYGYYIYDSNDLDYNLAPSYSWIEIENSGTNLNLQNSGKW